VRSSQSFMAPVLALMMFLSVGMPAAHAADAVPLEMLFYSNAYRVSFSVFLPQEESLAQPPEEIVALKMENLLKYIEVDEFSKVNMRAEPAMDAGIVAMLPGGALIEVLAEEGGWLHVVAFGDLEGYIRGDFQDTTALEPGRSDLSEARIVIWTDADEDTALGDTVTVYCDIENFYGWDYTLQWQQEVDSGRWLDVPGAHDNSHSFTLTTFNEGFRWRVKVDVVIPENESPQ